MPSPDSRPAERRIIVLWLVDLHRITIEIRVREQRGRPLEVHDREKELVVIFVDARAATDDLLELRHGVDALVEHDQMACLGINAGRHELRSRGDDRECRFRIDEVVELRFALFVVACDAHDVFVVGSGKVGIGIDQCLPHPLGMIDVFAKDDGLGETISGLEKLGDLGGNEFGALLQG